MPGLDVADPVLIRYNPLFTTISLPVLIQEITKGSELMGVEIATPVRRPKLKALGSVSSLSVVTENDPVVQPISTNKLRISERESEELR